MRALTAPLRGEGASMGKVHGGQALTASAISLALGGRMDGQIASLVHNGFTPGIMGGEQPGWRLAGGAGQHCKLRTTSLAVGKGGRSIAVPRFGAVPLETAQRQAAATATHRRSIRKVSSVAGSAKTMSGSFNI